MRTLVFQSYRPHDVPVALERSMASVRGWAASRAFDYRLLDDRFFDVLPPWYRERAGDNKLVLANLARLLVARDALAEGYDRAIWLDADVVVFDPDGFDVATADGFAWCRETWIERIGDDLVSASRVNNAVCAFDRDNRFLEFAIWAHEALVRDRPDKVRRFGTSTSLLTRIHAATPLPLVDGVAILSPTMVREIVDGVRGPMLQRFVESHGHAVQAANLTWSLSGWLHNGILATTGDYALAVERLIDTRGAAFRSAGDHAAGAASAQSRGTR